MNKDQKKFIKQREKAQQEEDKKFMKIYGPLESLCNKI